MFNSKKQLVVVISCLSCTLHTSAAEAQTLDELGNRASAMGAFVAVADDSAAAAWNPAGFINGPFFNIALDFGQSTLEPDPFASPPKQAGQNAVWYLSAGLPPLGLSYFRGRNIELSPAVAASSGRQDRQVVLRVLRTSHVGVTVLQSLAEGITVGATGRLVRGSYAGGVTTIASWDEGFERAERLDGPARNTGDVDVGALLTRGRFRLGLVARNLAAPTFAADDGAAFEVARHVRAGIAWGASWPGLSRTVLSFDADVTRVHNVGGERRDVAAGAERWFGNRRFAMRGGLRVSTVERARPIASVGGSYAVRSGIYVESVAAFGGDGHRRWGIAGRLTY